MNIFIPFSIQQHQPDPDIVQPQNHWNVRLETVKPTTNLDICVQNQYATVWIMDEDNYNLFSNGQAFETVGQHLAGNGALRLFAPPHAGVWYVVAHFNGPHPVQPTAGKLGWMASVDPV